MGGGTNPSAQNHNPLAQNPLAQNPLVPNQNSQATAPPPYPPYAPHLPHGPGNGETATHPSRIRQNLLSAINASRPHDSPTLFSRPETNIVKEQHSYCDVKPGHSLSYLSTSNSGMKIYGTASLSDPEAFLGQNEGGLEIFASLLLSLAGVFGLEGRTLHIFTDPHGQTIAFNRSGSLFANYRFFAQLHLAGLQISPAGANDPAAYQTARAQALIYWWVTLCHELAHNLVGDHGSDHSYYCEQFVAQFFPAVAGLVVGGGGDGGVGSDAQGQGMLEGGTGNSESGVVPQFERQFM